MKNGDKMTTATARNITAPPPDTFCFTPSEIRVFRIPEKISTAEWAERHRTVVDGGKKSPWRNEISPCAVGIMDALDLPYVREVYVQAPPQTVKTQAIINYLMRCIDQRPTSAMLVMPDEKLTKRIMRRRFIPSVRATPRTAAVISPRADDTTNLNIAFMNGMDIIGAWAGSPSSLSSDAMELMILDEMNKYPPPTGAEPNAFILARARTNSFPFTHKIYGGSTPTDETGLLSRVIRERADEIRYYFARCPICGEEQRMLWENISWGKSRDPREILRKKLARYHCSTCGMAWDDTIRDRAVLSMMKKGWRTDPKENKENAAPIERPRVIAFKLQSWYVQSISEAAAAFVEGQDDIEKLKDWVTQHAAEDWKQTIVPKKEAAILDHRTELPPLIVPAGAVALTAGIDRQKQGFWYVVRAWADDLTSWLINYGFLTSWGDVETLVWHTGYRIEGSQNTMDIWRAGIDTGGGLLDEGEEEEMSMTMTEEVYQWLRRQPPVGFAANGAPLFRIFGTKGGSYVSAMNVKRIKESVIDTMPHTKKPIPGGLVLRILDTNHFKHTLHWRLERRGEEAQQFYLHADTGEDYARQILAEEYGLDLYRKGKRRWRKRKGYAANHLLDCEVIAAACADGQWHPSLQEMAPYMRTERQRTQQPKATGDVKPQVARSNWMNRNR